MAEHPTRAARQYFADKAGAYRESRSHADADDLARMLAWTGARIGERALDVATGGGHTARALAQAGLKVVAADATLSMLAMLGPDEGAPVAADAQALPFRGGAFDLVVSRIAPHHFPDLPRFVGEAARVLRPEGRLYVFDLTTPPRDPERARLINHAERLRDPSHVDSYAPDVWRDALRSVGFRLERMRETTSTFDLEPWVARARMPPERERELRELLDAQRGRLGGYGLTPEGRMRVLRVELLARRA